LIACIAYPYRKGFPISTYIENVALVAQASVILALICIYNNMLVELAAVLLAFSAGSYFLFLGPFPPQLIPMIQILSTISCNYALFPQIYMTWKEKKAKWSAFSALLASGGNLIRVFTTLQLTKDPIILCGHILGFITNSILLLQTYIYR
jgi:mannose-P-dolichol utilization defect protein 1